MALRVRFEPNPLQCPNCLGLDITYSLRAAVWWQQRTYTNSKSTSTDTFREEIETTEYDEFVDIFCRECQHSTTGSHRLAWSS